MILKRSGECVCLHSRTDSVLFCQFIPSFYKINTFPRCSSWGVGGLQPVCLKLEGLLEILWARESLTAVLIV